MGIELSGKMGMGMRCWTGNGNGNGNDSTGMKRNGNNSSHCRTPLSRGRSVAAGARMAMLSYM